MTLSNLPPGVTDADIEWEATEGCCEVCIHIQRDETCRLELDMNSDDGCKKWERDEW